MVSYKFNMEPKDNSETYQIEQLPRRMACYLIISSYTMFDLKFPLLLHIPTRRRWPTLPTTTACWRRTGTTTASRVRRIRHSTRKDTVDISIPIGPGRGSIIPEADPRIRIRIKIKRIRNTGYNSWQKNFIIFFLVLFCYLLLLVTLSNFLAIFFLLLFKKKSYLFFANS